MEEPSPTVIVGEGFSSEASREMSGESLVTVVVGVCDVAEVCDDDPDAYEVVGRSVEGKFPRAMH